MTTTNTPATTDPAHDALRREDLQMFDLMHGAMRGGSRAVRDALADLAPLDRAGARELQDYFGHMHAEIVVHHTVEDEVFFPGMVAQRPDAARIEDELHDDHVRLDAALHRVEAALRRLVDNAADETARRHAHEAADALVVLLDDHLDREEAAILPEYLAHFTRADYARLDEQAGAYVNKKEFPFVGPWLLASATDDEAEWLFARTPRIVRWLYRWSWKPRFERRYPRLVGDGTVRTTRSASRIGIASSAAVVVAAVVVVSLAGCAAGATESADGHGHGGHDGHVGHGTVVVERGSSGKASRTVQITMDDFSFTTASSRVRPGVVTVQVDNVGAEAHQIQIGRPTGGLTAENFAERLERDGEAKVLGQMEWVGGANAVAPGESMEALAELTPGEYLIICFMPSPDGVSHLMKGMISTLVVEPGIPTTDIPTPDSTITVEDFRIAMPDGFSGRGLVEMRNLGDQDHEVIFVRADEGRTIVDAFAWYGSDQSTPPPFTFAGGIGTAEPGASTYARLDLPPGDYAAVCFLPDVAGDLEAHAKHGMVAQFSVS